MALAANTGGQDPQTTGLEPIIPGASTALGVVGTTYTGTPNAAFGQILTALVLRNMVDVLRDKATILQEAGFLRASYVPGTTTFRYTAFSDLPAAVDLLEGVPPQTLKLDWDTFEFQGGQKGNVVAITDLAELFNPFDLYSVAAEKVAWNAVDTAEKQAVALITGANVGVVIPVTGTTPVDRAIDSVVAMKKADVDPFGDGYYRTLISPTDASVFMKDASANGWTDTMKYASTEAILAGELGKFRGSRYIESNRIPDGKSVIYGPGFVAWGDYQSIQTYRVAPGGDHADPLAQRGLVGWKGMWGMTLVGFDGSPAMGPTSNIKGNRFGQVDLTP